jgi:hypothetical protein
MRAAMEQSTKFMQDLFSIEKQDEAGYSGA